MISNTELDKAAQALKAVEAAGNTMHNLYELATGNGAATKDSRSEKVKKLCNQLDTIAKDLNDLYS